MTLIKSGLILTSLGLAISTNSANAQDANWYVGVNAGNVSSDPIADSCNELANVFTSSFDANFSCDAEDSDTALIANVGYQINSIWGVEIGGMDLGEFSGTLNGDNSGTFATTGTNSLPVADAELSALYAVGTATWNFANNWAVLGRLGVAQVEIDARSLTEFVSVVVGEDDTVSLAGVELGYSFSKTWSANVRYDYLDVDGVDDIATIGIRARF